MFNWINHYSPYLCQVGFALVRIAVGAIFVRHGAAKVLGGPATWQWLGQQMNVFGITFLPIFWGLCSTAAELLGGIALIIGFGTRIAALFIAFNMVVALLMHIQKGDSIDVTEYPLLLLICAVAFVIAGAGKFALDAWLR